MARRRQGPQTLTSRAERERMLRPILSISAASAAIAVVLSSLWIVYGPRPQNGQDKRAAAVAPIFQHSRTGLDAKGQSIRTIAPGAPTNPGMVATAPTGSLPSATALTNPPASLKAPVEPDAPVRQGDSGSNPNVRRDNTPEVLKNHLLR